MYRNYAEVLAEVKRQKPVTISVAAAQDREVLEAVKLAEQEGIARCILVGNASLIKPLRAEIGLPDDTPVFDETDSASSVLKAIDFIRRGDAQILMKGMVNSSDFLRAVLDQQHGLRTGRLLSHLAVFEVPGQEKLLFITDGGMNIAPGLAEKRDILSNAMLALQAMGIPSPQVAILAANENVSPKMPATVDAKALCDLAACGNLPAGTVEGPVALDVAICPEAAHHKGIASEVSGKVDLMLVPNIETGNVMGKTLIYYGRAKMAGLVLGATHPIVMTSRSETADGKLNSIALACLMYSQQ